MNSSLKIHYVGDPEKTIFEITAVLLLYYDGMKIQRRRNRILAGAVFIIQPTLIKEKFKCLHESFQTITEETGTSASCYFYVDHFIFTRIGIILLNLRT